MPTYEYECEHCGYVWEAEQRIVEPPITDCPSCNNPTAKRLISPCAFHLKGRGWYSTDYPKPIKKVVPP